jgi:hypothetical protein
MIVVQSDRVFGVVLVLLVSSCGSVVIAVSNKFPRASSFLIATWS